jgi:hypothetical protein
MDWMLAVWFCVKWGMPFKLVPNLVRWRRHQEVV